MLVSSTIMQCGLHEKKPSKRRQLRLPTIAPKDESKPSLEGALSSPSASQNLGPSDVVVQPRSRLPPRSRTGCWTCRTRKVKCDEGRPECGQCSRLGHTCDYSPRVAFRDDTPRIVERMHDVSTAQDSVWNPKSPTALGFPSRSTTDADNLPPFASLTSDEDRERKAEGQSPGTYHVVVNPDSFSQLPEYNDDSVRDINFAQLSLRRGSLASSVTDSMVSSEGPERSQSGTPIIAITNDPNVVILSRFEDSSRRSNAQFKQKKSSNSPEISDRVQTKRGTESPQPRGQTPYHSTDPLAHIRAQGGQEAMHLDRFQDIIWPLLAQVGCFQVRPTVSARAGVAIFEEEAALFPPLFNAIMAVSALSYARRFDGQVIEALQYYDETLPLLQSSLHSDEDMCADGTFLTHFLLLVYEIISADSREFDLWNSHSIYFLNASIQRRKLYDNDRCAFILWLLFKFDTYATLGGHGSGNFSRMMLDMDMLPAAGFQLFLPWTGSDNDEHDSTMFTVLTLEYDTFVLLSKLSHMMHDFRKEQLMSPGVAQFAFDVEARLASLYEVREELHRLWDASEVHSLYQHESILAPHVRDIFHSALCHYHAAIIFSYENMWPTQRLDTAATAAAAPDLSPHTSTIIALAEDVLGHGRRQCAFVVVPTFMAGIASEYGSANHTRALELLQAFEGNGFGHSVGKIRQCMQAVYQRQWEIVVGGGSREKGRERFVDWVDVSLELELQIVTAGLCV